MPTARDVMVKKVVAINDSNTVVELGRILIKNKMSGLPVVDKGKKLVGFVSERDIIASLSISNLRKKKVKDIMNKKVTAVDKNTTMEEISKIFSEKPIRCLPVLDGGKLTGVVLRKAVINRLLGYYY